MTEAASGISGAATRERRRASRRGASLRWAAIAFTVLFFAPYYLTCLYILVDPPISALHAAAGACGARRRIRMARSRPHLAEPRDPGDRRRGRALLLALGRGSGARSTQPPMPSRRAGRRAAAARSRCRPRRTSSSGTGPPSCASHSSCRWPPTWISCWASSGLWKSTSISWNGRRASMAPRPRHGIISASPRSELTPQEAAQLAAALPNPKRRNAGRPGPRVFALAKKLKARAARQREGAACVLGEGDEGGSLFD